MYSEKTIKFVDYIQSLGFVKFSDYYVYDGIIVHLFYKDKYVISCNHAHIDCDYLEPFKKIERSIKLKQLLR